MSYGLALTLLSLLITGFTWRFGTMGSADGGAMVARCDRHECVVTDAGQPSGKCQSAASVST